MILNKNLYLLIFLRIIQLASFTLHYPLLVSSTPFIFHLTFALSCLRPLLNFHVNCRQPVLPAPLIGKTHLLLPPAAPQILLNTPLAAPMLLLQPQTLLYFLYLLIHKPIICLLDALVHFVKVLYSSEVEQGMHVLLVLKVAQFGLSSSPLFQHPLQLT